MRDIDLAVQCHLRMLPFVMFLLSERPMLCHVHL